MSALDGEVIEIDPDTSSMLKSLVSFIIFHLHCVHSVHSYLGIGGSPSYSVYSAVFLYIQQLHTFCFHMANLGVVAEVCRP